MSPAARKGGRNEEKEEKVGKPSMQLKREIRKVERKKEGTEKKRKEGGFCPSTLHSLPSFSLPFTHCPSTLHSLPSFGFQSTLKRLPVGLSSHFFLCIVIQSVNAENDL
jgi:hypothetical protein